MAVKHPKIILNRCTYTISRKSFDKTTWMCTSYYKTKCKSRLTTSGNCVKVSGNHNHAPNGDSEKCKNMVSQVVSIVKT
jgi:hypothetical protein